MGAQAVQIVTPFTVSVNVDRTQLARGINVGHITITSGTAAVQVTVEVTD